MQAVYDEIGQSYVVTRQPDPRIAQAIRAALGAAHTVLNVGAGTGSYEPADLQVVAVEPSRAMIQQRPAGTAPVVIVDQPSLQGLLAAQAQPPVPVGQWWLRTAHGEPPRLAAGASVVTWDRSAAALLGDPLPNVPQLALLVIAVAAALLASRGAAPCRAAHVGPGVWRRFLADNPVRTRDP